MALRARVSYQGEQLAGLLEHHDVRPIPTRLEGAVLNQLKTIRAMLGICYVELRPGKRPLTGREELLHIDG